MADLPHDLINEILLWLPVKSLVRFRCVSKSFYENIDSQGFIYSHIDKSSNNRRNRKLIWRSPEHDDPDARIVALDFSNGFQKEFRLNSDKKPYKKYLLHASFCNGLVLLNPSYNKFKFYVWNPSTRHERELPGPTNFSLDYNKIYRFGYDATTDDYKVILVNKSLDNLEQPYNEVWIYGLKSNCWRRVQDFPRNINYKKIETLDGNTCIDGCVYFLCNGDRGGTDTIVVFDVSKETFSIVPLPIYQGEGTRVRYICLQAFEECLSIKALTPKKVDLFVRKKEGVEFSWTKLFSLTTKQSSVLFGDGKMFNYGFVTLGYSKEGDNKILLLWIREMYSFDLKERNLQKIGMSNIDGFNSILCMESLVSVHIENSEDEECRRIKRNRKE